MYTVKLNLVKYFQFKDSRTMESKRKFKVCFKLERENGRKKLKVSVEKNSQNGPNNDNDSQNNQDQEKDVQKTDGKNNGDKKNDGQITYYGFGSTNPDYLPKAYEFTAELFSFRTKIPTEIVHPDGKRSPASLFNLACEAHREERFTYTFMKANMTGKYTPASGKLLSAAMKMLVMTPDDVKKLAGIAV